MVIWVLWNVLVKPLRDWIVNGKWVINTVLTFEWLIVVESSLHSDRFTNDMVGKKVFARLKDEPIVLSLQPMSFLTIDEHDSSEWLVFRVSFLKRVFRIVNKWLNRSSFGSFSFLGNAHKYGCCSMRKPNITHHWIESFKSMIRGQFFSNILARNLKQIMYLQSLPGSSNCYWFESHVNIRNACGVIFNAAILLLLQHTKYLLIKRNVFQLRFIHEFH